jgi:hypothetical protein
MAYDLTNGSTTNHKSRTGANVPYTVEKTVSMADATTAKGSALANADVLEVIPVPANTLVHGAVAYVETVDSSTAATFDIDVAAGDDFIDGGDFNTVGWAAAGSNGLLPFGANSVVVASADTIDVKLNVGGSVVQADGVIRVVAYMSDLAEIPGPAEVGRDFA